MHRTLYTLNSERRMSMHKWHKVIAIILAILIFVAVCYTAGWLLMPVRVNFGSTWESYLMEDRDTIDVLFFGSSMVYCDVIPAVIWEESGIASYVMAGPEQTIPISYYYIKEACRTQSPKTVVLELTGMFFNQYQSYTKVNIGYMPWSINRLAATFEAAEKSEIAGLLFPLYNYHDRIYQDIEADVRRHFNPKIDLWAGYTYLPDAREQTEIVERSFSAETDTYKTNLAYLYRIADYCKQNNMQLILYVAPAMARIPEEALQTLKSDVEGIEGATYIDFNERIDATGIDHRKDWYDNLHFNFSGALKFSSAFASFLEEYGQIKPSEKADKTLWQQRVDLYQVYQGDGSSGKH